MHDSASSLKAKLRDWLRTQGYPLEMAVASAFRRNGLLVAQSEYYRDPDTHLPREIDVVVYRDSQLGNYALRLMLVVECKASKDKPWVLFTSHPRVRFGSPTEEERSIARHRG